ncbi:MAG TPA: CBS domain-containing protein [Roseiflexaceae bacterium]|nr:CBS domain-containing protein [Roseiflexaceae bacterium]
MEKQYVRDVMHAGVISCPSETPVEEALRVMQANRIHALVVVDGPGYLAGIVSQTDLLRAWQDGSTYEKVMRGPVSTIMTASVVSCMPDMELGRAIKLLNRHRIHRLVVVEERNDGRFWPVGILSMTDLVRAMDEGEVQAEVVHQDQTPVP